ncbi:serine/threonine-protein kinase-like protein CCR4 [Neltuma alba]|uniref:serine/threonine-protein kinase-like protein CCR4 n=1 Tax=Neltuma alba TaxID=207710 RepID=UPI0010A4DA32|nr:serine/threonine-protein kinase-like protein CCR4 [Prosopis alba]
MASILNPSFCRRLLLILLYFVSSFLAINSLSSSVSISGNSSHTLICALQSTNRLQGQKSFLNCTSFPTGIKIQVNPNISFSEIAGGNGFVCALRPQMGSSSSSSSVMFCWRFSTNETNVAPKRIYHGPMIQNLEAGNSQICGLSSSNNGLNCWQWPGFNTRNVKGFSSISVGENFVCGLSETSGNINCRGNKSIIGDEPKGNYSVIAAGTRYACAISSNNGSLHCWGDVPKAAMTPQGRFISLALGDNRSCALRAVNRTVDCWGTDGFSTPESFRNTSFEAITAKGSVFCGVMSNDYSLHCWGNDNLGMNGTAHKVFDEVLPGPCRTDCSCGPLPGSAQFCDLGRSICSFCDNQLLESQPPLPPSASSQSRQSNWSSKMVAFLVVGCVGSVSLMLVLAFFVYRYCKGRGCRRVHDSGRLDEPEDQPAIQPTLEKRLSHMISMGNGGHLEEFSWQILLEATNNFSEDQKIGTGSFGSVYHATLKDGKEVAIKRAEISPTSPSDKIIGGSRRQEDKDDAFVNELESLSRLNHKNLVRLLGFFEDNNERILVYDFMTNGSLTDHLHKLHTSTSNPNSPLMSWSGRIKVALDAARGIEYLHKYAIPPIIHRDIKSANILLDSKWTAKVSDFGLSLMGPEDEESHLSLLAAGTVGYMDPEYYRLQHLTTKSDVYSFGVVLLELLCGYKAIHRNENGTPRNVVDFVVPYIEQDEIHRVLDRRLPPPTPYEIEAVAFVGYLAADCVRFEGRERPTMTDVVNKLEIALDACLAQPKPTISRFNSGSDSD